MILLEVASLQVSAPQICNAATSNDATSNKINKTAVRPLFPVGDLLPPTSKGLYTSCNAGNWNPSPAPLLRRSNLKRRVPILLRLVLSSFFSPKKPVVLCLTSLHMEFLSHGLRSVV